MSLKEAWSIEWIPNQRSLYNKALSQKSQESYVEIGHFKKIIYYAILILRFIVCTDSETVTLLLMVKNQDLRVNVKSAPVNNAFLGLVLNILCTAHVEFQTTLWATQLPKATHSHLLTPGRKYSTAAEDTERQNTAVFKVKVQALLSLGEKSTCLSMSYSPWHPDRSWGKGSQGGDPTCWFGNLVFLWESRVSSSGPSQLRVRFPLEAQSCGIPSRIQNSHTVPPNTTDKFIQQMSHLPSSAKATGVTFLSRFWGSEQNIYLG